MNCARRRYAALHAGLLGCLLLLCALPSSLRAQNDAEFVDISIRVFDAAAEDAAAIDGEATATGSGAASSGTAAATAGGVTTAATLVPEAVTQAEVRYMPMHLRYHLEASGRFGAVRVLPLLDNGAELMIEGRIIASDQFRLELAITARDSTGRLWLQQTYSGSAVSSTSLSPDAKLDDDFADLYRSIVRDLVAVLDTLQSSDLREIASVALLRYGQGLAPQHFDSYLESSDGRWRALRLPASNDPFLVRVQAIREREFLFIDVVDEEYSRFHADIKPVYDMWRQYRREQSSSAEARTARESTATSEFARGSYYALQESYNNFRWAKLQELYLDELSEGFSNETASTEIELSDSLYRLSGTMEQQYREWRSILAELYELETAGQ